MVSRNRKGISPLIAVLMLIAFTLVVAGIVASYATQFAVSQRSLIEFCTGARVIVHSSVFSQSSGDTTVNIFNFGSIDLDFNVLLSYTNGSVSKAGNISVAKGEIGNFVLPNTDPTSLDSITVQSERCAGAQDFIKATDIKTVS